MTRDPAAFTASLAADAPPADVTPALQALWWDAKGEWDRAHEIAQNDHGAAGALVHGFLHRREGDLANARYWYTRAGRNAATDDLASEWRRLVEELLAAE